MPQAKVLIIGGGSSGLTAAGALKNAGIDSIILDKDAHIGDIWRRRYERLRLHTIRGLSYMAYHKMPDDYPRYVPKEKFADYMQDYATHFNLDIRHNCTVTQVSQQNDSTWQVTTQDGIIWTAQHVVIATGINRVPFTPQWKELNSYTGNFSHSHDYKIGADYANQHVLVIGCGNSGAEICADLVESGAAVIHNSIRNAPMLVPRDPFGVPIQVWGIPMSLLGQKIGDTLADWISHLQLGNLEEHGLPKRDWQIFKHKRIPTIDVGYVEWLKQGKITIKPDIEHFTAHGVQFVDGTKAKYDAVIAATGYRANLRDFLDLPELMDETGNLTVPCGEPTPYKGLWFIGLASSPAGILMAARMQSRKLADYISQ